LRAILLSVFLLAGQLHAAAGQSSSIPVSEFVSELDTLTTALSTASASDAGALAARVPLRWRVNTGADEIAVDGTWIVHAARDAASSPDKWPERRKQIVARLIEIRAHAAERADARSLTSTRESVRSTVGTVLERGEFQQGGESWLSVLSQRVGDWLRRLLDRVGASGLATRQSAEVLAWIAAVAAFAGLGIWLARFLDRPQHGAAMGLARTQTPRLSAREWTSRAMGALSAGDTREATRCAYNAAIRRVEEEGGWRIDHARTPREYLPLLGAHDARRGPVRELTEQFERAWYGNRTASADEVRSVMSNLEKLGCLAAAD
jgi:hypothetical protein